MQPLVARANSRARRTTRPRAFTLIELLAVLGIIGVLISLMIPAAAGARDCAASQCLSNLKQIGFAVLARAERSGRFPASGNFDTAGVKSFHNWVVDILADLEHQDIQNAWSFDQPWNDAAQSDNARLGATSIKILCCPSDISIVPGNGNLSYVVNGGFGWTVPTDCPVSPHWTESGPTLRPFDLNGDGVTCPPIGTGEVAPGDKQIYLQTGLFFIENWPPSTGVARSRRLASITDGYSTTLMLSENIRAGYDPVRKSNWSCPSPPRNSFFVSSYVCEGSRCSAGRVDYSRANDRSGVGPQAVESINSSVDQAEGEAPWPSSLHKNGVNAVFCDGHAAFVSDTVRGDVYAKLVSPQGAKVTGPLRQGPLDESGF